MVGGLQCLKYTTIIVFCRYAVRSLPLDDEYSSITEFILVLLSRYNISCEAIQKEWRIVSSVNTGNGASVTEIVLDQNKSISLRSILEALYGELDRSTFQLSLFTHSETEAEPTKSRKGKDKVQKKKEAATSNKGNRDQTSESENEDEVSSNSDTQASTWSRKGKTKTKPGVIKTEPRAIKTEHRVIKTEPEATKTEPGAIKTEPGATKTKPGATKTEPGTTKTEPRAAKTELGGNVDQVSTSSSKGQSILVPFGMNTRKTVRKRSYIELSGSSEK